MIHTKEIANINIVGVTGDSLKKTEKKCKEAGMDDIGH
jgi:hypothetical protein